MKEKLHTAAAATVVVLGGLLLGFLFFRYLFGVLVPFAVGWGVALLVRRPAEVLSERLRLRVGLWRLLLSALLTALLGALAFFGVRGLLTEASSLLSRLESGEVVVGGGITALLSRIPFLSTLFPNTEAVLDRVGDWVLTALPAAVSRLAAALPGVFLGGVFSLIATFYFCLDLERVHEGMRRILPERWQRNATVFKSRAVRVGLTVLRTDLLLMLIAFALVFVGFLLLGVRYPLLLSALFSLFDFLPAVGVGTLLIPWGLWLLITGEVGRGIGLLALAVVVAIVRQLVEPRLLGARYELHPLLTLLSMYAGARLFGALGLLLAPMLLLLLRATLFEEKGPRAPDREKTKKPFISPI